MSRIYGIVCDGCQKVDAVSADNPMHEDSVPRNGWMSLNIWGKVSEEGRSKYPSIETEIHACSLDCVDRITYTLKLKQTVHTTVDD